MVLCSPHGRSSRAAGASSGGVSRERVGGGVVVVVVGEAVAESRRSREGGEEECPFLATNASRRRRACAAAARTPLPPPQPPSFSPRALTSPRRDHPQMLSTSPRPVLRRPCPRSDARANHGHLAIVFPRRRCACAPAKTRRVPVLISLCARCFQRSAPLNSLLTSYLSNQHSNVRTQRRTVDIYTPSQVALVRVYASWKPRLACACLHTAQEPVGCTFKYFHGHRNDRPVTPRTSVPSG